MQTVIRTCELDWSGFTSVFPAHFSAFGVINLATEHLESRFCNYSAAGFIRFHLSFLPAVKPTGNRSVRVVVVVGDYFEVMTSRVKVNPFFGQGQVTFFCLCSPYPILKSPWGGIHQNQSWFIDHGPV